MESAFIKDDNFNFDEENSCYTKLNQTFQFNEKIIKPKKKYTNTVTTTTNTSTVTTTTNTNFTDDPLYKKISETFWFCKNNIMQPKKLYVNTNNHVDTNDYADINTNTNANKNIKINITDPLSIFLKGTSKNIFPPLSQEEDKFVNKMSDNSNLSSNHYEDPLFKLQQKKINKINTNSHHYAQNTTNMSQEEDKFINKMYDNSNLSSNHYGDP